MCNHFVYYNPNPLKKKTDDCAVRALSIATGKDWDDVYKELCDLGFELKMMPDSKEACRTYLTRAGFAEVSLTDSRPTVNIFAINNPTGVYVLETTPHHLVTVIDGFYFDNWNCGRRMVLAYWEKRAPVI